MKVRLAASIAVVGLISLVIASGFGNVAAAPLSNNLKTGPYVDRVVYKVISNEDQRILALQAGMIDIDTSLVDPVNLPALEADPDISIFNALGNGYSHITINCRDYPLNITGLRRAFAYAFNKTRVTSEIMEGYAQEHDSVVPYVNTMWCIEDDMQYHYYTAEVIKGNQLLNASGFDIDGGTGFRLAPNGSAFDIHIEYPSSSPMIGRGIAQIGVDALHALHIDASAVAVEFNDYTTRLNNHGNYDMIVDKSNFYDNNVDWLAYEYWSDYANTAFMNPTNFVNVTYDSWRNQLLHSSTYGEVYQASSEMQRILQYNVPILVVYENSYLQAYRNDRFTGHVPDLASYISGQWTMRKIHKLDGTMGGDVSASLAQEPDSFNIFVTGSPYSERILQNLHASLYKYGPDLTLVSDLADSLLLETHTDNAEVPEGHMRYTIDIIQNATWSDDTPLTAEDVAFTFLYQYESGAYGNPAKVDIESMVAAYSPTPYRAVLEFNDESYWQFSKFAFDYIIPEHIFNDVDGIGYEGWSTWNPVFNPADPYVTCGPFMITDYEAGEFYEISKNPSYHWLPVEPPHTGLTPLVSSPGDIEYEVGTTGHEIAWIASDDDPLIYMVLKDNTPLISASWDGDDIHVSIDGLSLGHYNYTLILMDYSLNMVSDTVWVNVVQAAPTTTTTGTTEPTTTSGNGIVSTIILIVSGGSVIVIIVVLVVIYKTKNQ
jgi:ABC-type transport system substrate-binding protein